ncbi:MAG: sigma-54 dependent transcriptional regulator [candidate division KSB1 bacterium]|nr:sigma-54 dependent transcriptional regulator [candidate division KSB1 bacterium]
MTRSEQAVIVDPAREEHWREVQRDVGIIGESDKTRQLIETIEQVAPTDISVLITGESGTGKELVARAIHLRSKRRNAPLITVNSSAIPEGILESELFGHEKGSFTGASGTRKGYFELAHRGSIFLDEIGELPLSIQAKLLRVLEVREFMRVGGTVVQEVDVRFIAATNRRLDEEVRKGNFRQDLYFRLNAVHIHVPALRERREDIIPLAQKFINDFCRHNHIEFEGFTESAYHLMQQYDWPGNVRELRNLVEKVIVLERGRRIDDVTLRKYISPYAFSEKALPVPIERPKEELERELLLRVLLEIKSEIAQLRELLLAGGSKRYSLYPWRGDAFAPEAEVVRAEEEEAPETMRDMEREMIISTLAKTNGNRRQAAKILGISERTLYRKILKYGLRDEKK